jgi:hypothetical protein
MFWSQAPGQISVWMYCVRRCSTQLIHQTIAIFVVLTVRSERDRPSRSSDSLIHSYKSFTSPALVFSHVPPYYDSKTSNAS